MTTYDMEGGTQGGNATAATTGGNTNVVAGAGNTLTHDSVAALLGTLGLKLVVGTTNPDVFEFSTSTATPAGTNPFVSSTINCGLAPLFIPAGGFATAVGASFTTLIQFYGTSTGTTATARLRADDKPVGPPLGAQVVKFSDAAASQVVTVVADLTPYENTWVAFRWQIDTGTTNVTGDALWRFYSDPFAAVNSNVGTEAHFVTGNLGSAAGTGYPITRVRGGVITTQAAGKTVYADNWVINGGGTKAWVPQLTAPSGPVPVLTADNTLPGVGDTITLTTSATTGATVSRTLSVLSYPAGTTPPTITNPTTTTTTTVTGLQAGQTVIRLRAVGSSTVDTTVTIYTHALNNADVKVQQATLNTWTNEGGAADGAAAQNDVSDATYLQSPTNPTAADAVVDTYQPYGDGNITMNLRYRQVNDAGDTSSGATWFADVYKEDGTTKLNATPYTWTTTAADSGVWKEQPIPFDTTMHAAVPGKIDRRALKLKWWGVIT